VAPGRQSEALFDDLLPPRPRGLHGVTVVISPRAHDEPLAPDVVAPVLGLSDFQASQLIRRTGSVHMVFDETRAPSVIEAAQAANIPVVSFDRGRLDALPEAERVLTLELPASVADTRVAYRESHDPEVLRLAGTRSESHVRLGELALVVAGRIDIELERQVSMGSILHANGEDPLDRMSSRPRVRDYDGRLVFDLWTHEGRSFRLLELHTTINGDGFAQARRGAAFGALRRWLATRAPKVEFADGFARHATPRRRRLDRVSAGIPWSPTSKSGVVAQQVRDTGAAWDGWSASCFTLFRLRKNEGHPT